MFNNLLVIENICYVSSKYFHDILLKKVFAWIFFDLIRTLSLKKLLKTF